MVANEPNTSTPNDFLREAIVELYENRILNGILKDVGGVANPEMARGLLARDLEIFVNPDRQSVDDLWPCVWALAAVLSKQFEGRILVRSGFAEQLAGPIALPAAVSFSGKCLTPSIRIGVGCRAPTGGISICGDARSNLISFGSSLDAEYGKAGPISCFALAGYLGFAALAHAVGIPAHREEYCQTTLALPFCPKGRLKLPADGVAILGLGQLGQDYLSLLFFLARGWTETPKVFLLDKDEFELPNRSTQVLLSESDEWSGAQKAPYLAALVRAWGWESFGDRCELKWGYKRKKDEPRLVMLGLDDFDARRIAIESGYEWVVEAGIGTSFVRPRVTWHSLCPERKLGLRLFGGAALEQKVGRLEEKPFFEELRRTPGKCGWVVFNNIRASAPSMGLVAAAYAWAEMMSATAGESVSVGGSVYLWSPLLPYLRESLAGKA
jgi:hypothetical protein